MKRLFLIIAAVAILSLSLSFSPGDCSQVSYKTMAFYYLWYSNPADGYKWGNWDDGGQTPPLNIYSIFYPVLGCYVSNQENIMRTHLEWFQRAGVGVAIIPWFGEGWIGETGDKLFGIADEYDIKICYQIEIYDKRTLDTIKRDIKLLMDKWGSHPSVFKYKDKMMFFVFDPTNFGPGPPRFSLSDWKTMIDGLHAEGYHPLLLPGTLDASWLTVFDGLYQYDVAGFASQHSSLFPQLSSHCKSQGKIFAPSIGPGFDNSRLVTSGTPLIADRKGTTQYDDYWKTIVNCAPTFVTITSFNEWGESTNIEPATIDPPKEYNYQTFSGITGKKGAESEMVFIDRTRYWVKQYDASLSPYAPTYNILLNSSFEYNSSWEFTNSKWEYTTSTFKTGNRSLRLDAQGDTWAVWATQNGIPVNDGATYKITFYAKKTPGFQGTPDVLIRCRDDLSKDVWLMNFPITESWEQYSLTYKPPSGVDKVDLLLHCDGIGPGPTVPSNYPKGVIYWDDISFSKAQ